MSDDPALDKLKSRINKAKEQGRSRHFKENQPLTRFGKLFNVGVELISGVFMGVGCGLFIDWAFGTSPWGLISLFILGSAAGLLNVYRTLTIQEKTDNDKETHV